MNSIWLDNRLNNTFDLAIIGAGFVGLSAAIHFKRANPGKQVCILEKHSFSNGASVRNAGFACFGSPSELLSDIEHESLDAAVSRVKLRWDGLQGLIAEIGENALKLEKNDGYEVFATDNEPYTSCKEKFELLNEALARVFGKAVFEWADDKLKAFGFNNVSHLAKISNECSIDPGKAITSLWNKAQGLGVELIANANVLRVEETATNAKIELSNKRSMHAEQLVIATNAFTTQLIPEVELVPGRGQILLTSPIANLKFKGNFHLDRGYYYFRPVGNRVLLGGGRNLDFDAEQTTELGITPTVQNKLEELLRDVILPNEGFEIEKRWSGIMAFGATKAPIVKRHSDRIILAVRAGGMGVAIGHTLGKRAAKLASES